MTTAGPAHPTSAAGGGAPPHKWVVAGTVLTGTIMAVLDSSIVNVALPDMSGTLGATIEQITWVVTGYILSNVIIMPILVFVLVAILFVISLPLVMMLQRGGDEGEVVAE